jgi:O-antigen ligase
VGTQARTGLVCAAFLVVLGLRDSKRRMTYLGIVTGAALIALPLVPAAFASRMDTITDFRADQSASTRIAVWQWTWNYALEHPLGGGFESYRGNELRVNRIETGEAGDAVNREIIPYTDRARAFHNSYFEMLGEQGFPGLAMWLYIQIVCLWRMEKLRRRYRESPPDVAWVRPLATALQGGHLVYLMGSMFVGIAFQPFIYMLIALQIGLWTYTRRRETEARWRPLTTQLGVKPPPIPGTVPAHQSRWGG